MTTTFERFDVFDPELLRAMDLVSDPSRTVCRDILKGEMSGKFDLHNAVFPPSNVHRNSVPLVLRFTMEGWVDFELHLMTMMYSDMMSGPFMALGLMTHDQHEEMRKTVVFPSGYRMQFIAVRYSFVTRLGSVFIPRETYAILEIAESDNLLRMRRDAMKRADFEALHGRKPEHLRHR